MDGRGLGDDEQAFKGRWRGMGLPPVAICPDSQSPPANGIGIVRFTWPSTNHVPRLDGFLFVGRTIHTLTRLERKSATVVQRPFIPLPALPLPHPGPLLSAYHTMFRRSAF